MLLVILESECPQDFALQSKLDAICHLSSEMLFSDNVLLTKPAARFCHTWELAIIFIKKLCKLKMRTSLTSVQIHRRKGLEKILIISISHGVIVCLRLRSKFQQEKTAKRNN